MTDDVARHVLAHNYDQTLSLSLLEVDAAGDLDAQARLMHDLEARGRLDRVLEGLPSAIEVGERAMLGKGLTRPELAVLLAYGKLDLFDDIIASAAPDDPWFAGALRDYFPDGLARFGELMGRHRLRREIIATVVDNQMVNLCGPTFAARLRASAGCDTRALVAAFEAARQVLRFDEIWRRVAHLDLRAPAAAQTALFRELVSLLRGQTFWLARLAMRDNLSVRDMVETYRPAVDALKDLAPRVLSPFERKAAVRRAAGWVKAGAPKAIAHTVAVMQPLTLATTLTDLARASDRSRLV